MRRLFEFIRPRFGTSHAIALLGAGFILVLTIGLILHVQDLRRSEFARGVERSERLAQAVDNHAARTFDNAALTLERVRDQLAVNPSARRLDDPAFKETLLRIVRLVPDARVHVIDAAGRLRHSAPGEQTSAGDFSTHPAFLVHRDGLAGFRIAAPSTSRSSGERQIVMTTRLEDERGRFNGVAALAIPLRSFAATYDSLRGVGGESVSLHLADGTLLVRSPFDPARSDAPAIARDAAAEMFAWARTTSISGFEPSDFDRIVRPRHLADWPIMVIARSDAAKLRAIWLAQATRYTTIAILMGLVTAVLIAVLIRQVEQRHASERRLRGAVDNVTEAFAIYDSQDRVVLCTRAFALHYAGVDQPEALVGLSYEDITRRSLALGERPDDGMMSEQWIDHCLAHHANPPEMPWIRRLAGNRFALVSERRLPDGGAVGVSTDVTAIKQREQQLELARQDAELANRTKTRFLAAMSHELRTPLNAILGFSEVIRDLRFGRTSLDRYATYAGDIHRSGQHLLELISDLLDTSKIEAGRYTLHEDVLDPMSVIDDAIGMVRERARNAGVRLRIQTEEELPLVYGDDRALRQVLLNLLTNAIKFTPKTGRAEIYGAVDQDGWLRIAVGDTGAGIPAAIRPRLFQPFAQAGCPMVRNHEGSGLGLAISRGIVELHGGTIAIESEEGAGTIVTLRLPPDRLRPRTDPMRRAS